jgi:hypothetical protein
LNDKIKEEEINKMPEYSREKRGSPLIWRQFINPKNA